MTTDNSPTIPPPDSAPSALDARDLYQPSASEFVDPADGEWIDGYGLVRAADGRAIGCLPFEPRPPIRREIVFGKPESTQPADGRGERDA